MIEIQKFTVPPEYARQKKPAAQRGRTAGQSDCTVKSHSWDGIERRYWGTKFDVAEVRKTQQRIQSMAQPFEEVAKHKDTRPIRVNVSIGSTLGGHCRVVL